MLAGPSVMADSGPIRPVRKPEIERYAASKSKPGGEPEMVMDRLNNTGWITGSTGCGKDASITLFFKETRYLTHVSILPGLAGKLTASAIRVPTPNVSLAILNLTLKRETNREELNEYLRQCSMESELQEQLDWTGAPDVVSIDQVGNDHASIIDATATIVEGNKAVVYAWYDNEYGYSAQCVRLLADVIGMNRPAFP